MKQELDAVALLAMWWRAEDQWSPVEGFPAECPSTRGYRTSRQYDSGPEGNGADDTDARGMLIRHIGGIVESIEEPYKSALYQVAKNYGRAGPNVWQSARLPADRMERLAVITEAIRRFEALV